MIKSFSVSQKGVLSESLSSLQVSRKTFFIDCLEPKEAELKELVSKVGVTLSDLKNCLDPHEHARIENRKNYSLIILRAVSLKGRNPTVPIGIFLFRNAIVLVHGAELKGVSDLLEDYKTLLISDSLSDLIYTVLHHLLLDFSLSLDTIEEAFAPLEDKALFTYDKNYPTKIFSSRKTLLYLRKSLSMNREVIDLIGKGYVPWIRDLEPFSRLYTEFIQLIDVEELFRERLTSTIDIHLSATSNRLNEVMRSFTVIASLLLVPTVISSIYGMNFLFLPFAKHPLGFYFTIGFMAISVSMMLLFFRKKQWL